MIDPCVQRDLEAFFQRSRWMRFSLEYARGRWRAVFSHETGRIYGNSNHQDPQVAVSTALAQALRNTKHLA